MDSDAGHRVLAALPAGRLAGREVFAQTVRDALAWAAREGWEEIILSDASFEDWPLCERAVVESLQAWSKSGRHLTLLATRYDEVQRRHPRFVAWRQTWGHIIDCRVCRSADPQDFPSAIWSPGWVMQRIDSERGIFLCGKDDRGQRVALRELLDEWLRSSSPGFPASVLGL